VADQESKRRSRLDPDAYVRGIQEGNRVILSRAITLVESRRPEDRKIADEIINACLPLSGRSMRIGITGVPGAGKSTLIEALGKRVTAGGHRLAVLAIDPSSEHTHGSILGDKTRMEELGRDPNVYVRPSPTAGSLGGVAGSTREAMILCEAAGFDVVFVETTGVGQAEYAVRSMVDFFLLLVLAGAGDELQGIKRGILEAADVIAVTKADGANRDAAEAARRMYAGLIKLLPGQTARPTPHVLTCSALENEGIDELWKVIEAFFRRVETSGVLEETRRQQARSWMEQTVEQRLLEAFYSHTGVRDLLPSIEQDVLNGLLNPRMAADRLLDAYRAK
jgi:LAO/AO transport system kinase